MKRIILTATFILCMASYSFAMTWAHVTVATTGQTLVVAYDTGAPANPRVTEEVCADNGPMTCAAGPESGGAPTLLEVTNGKTIDTGDCVYNEKGSQGDLGSTLQEIDCVATGGSPITASTLTKP